MTGAVLGGWAVALALAMAAVRLRMRLEAVGDAAHELRGAATTMALAAASMRLEPGGLRRAHALESEMARLRAGLDDLDVARGAVRARSAAGVLPLERVVRIAAAGWRPAAVRRGRRVSLRWEAGTAAVRADRGRMAQLLGNLMANALEHGSGPVRLSGRRRGASVVVEVADSGPASSGAGSSGAADRGRGLAIAARAAEEAGGRLTVTRSADGTTAAVELPVADP